MPRPDSTPIAMARPTTSNPANSSSAFWVKTMTGPARWWNPWDVEDRKAEIEAAQDVMEQWTRAEPGFRPKTAAQVDAWMRREDRKAETERAARAKRHELARARYDAQRQQNRLALLEQQAIHDRAEQELVGYRSGERFPGISPERRRTEISELEHRAKTAAAEIVRLTPLVGDPETVVDQNGWSQQDRREHALFTFGFNREQQIRQLRTAVADLNDELRLASERQFKAEVRKRLAEPKAELDRLLAIPPLGPEDMCPDCWRPCSSTARSGPAPSLAGRAAHGRSIAHTFSGSGICSTRWSRTTTAPRRNRGHPSRSRSPSSPPAFRSPTSWPASPRFRPTTPTPRFVVAAPTDGRSGPVLPNSQPREGGPQDLAGRR